MNVRVSKLALLGGASAMALAAIGLTSPVMAQTAGPGPVTAQEQVDEDAETLDEVVVTGIRASLASAQAIKQNSDQFVDSITAVDIGRLPDVNVAEALQRVSGIQITRQYGEGNGIAVRGLTKVRSELNGRDIFSASGGRGLSWEEVGSDLLAGVDVYKNPSAEMIEGGLGGTINLRTRMPFDAAGRIISGSASYTHYDLANDDGYNGSFLISDRFDTSLGEFGVLLNASFGETSFRSDKVYIEPYFDRTGEAAFAGESLALVPNGGGMSVGFGNRERMSVAGAVQWRPTDNLEFYAQVLRADYQFEDRGLSFAVYSGGQTPMVVAPGATFTFDENGVSQTGSFLNPQADVVTFGNTRETDTTDFAVGFKWRPSERLGVSADLQYVDSNVYQQTVNLTQTIRTAVNGPQNYDWGSPPYPLRTPTVFFDNYVFSYDTTGDYPTFSASDNFFANINNYGLAAILPYRELNDASSWAGRIDLTWDFEEGGFLRDVRYGVRATDRTAINRTTTYGTWSGVGDCSEWGTPASCYTAAANPENVQLNPFNQSFLGGQGSPFGDVYLFGLDLVTDADATFAYLNNTFGTNYGWRDFNDPDAQLSNVTETTQSFYGIVRFGSQFLGRDYDGNLGIRVVRSEAAADGFQTINYRDPDFVPGTDPVTGQPLTPERLQTVTAIEGGNTYTEFLPSLNLRLHLTDTLQLRFAASRNLSRPDFGQLNSQVQLSPAYASDADNTPIAGQPGTGNAQGNPNLNPEKVTQFDASAEWYFSRVGFVYATVFQKTIEDLIVQQNFIETYDIPSAGGTQSVDFNVLRFVNVDEGQLRGFEIGGQRFFDFLPSPLDGLGIQANYTYIDSDATTIAANAQTGGGSIDVPIQGLSESSYNLVLLYEKYGFNGRIAYNWRDDYLQTTQGVGTGQLPIFGAAYGVLDASLSYDFNASVALTFDAQNILNEEFQSYQLEENRLRDYQVDDRRFSVRLRVRY